MVRRPRFASSLLALLVGAVGLLPVLAPAPAHAVGYDLAVAWGTNAAGQSTVPAGLAEVDVVALAAGFDHSLALTSDGQVVAWGSNSAGQTTVPPALAGQQVVAIDAEAFYSLALTADGQLYAWGNLNNAPIVVPAPIQAATVTAIAAAPRHVLVVTATGEVVGWGNNFAGALTIPAELDGRQVSAVAGGDLHSLALTSDGEVFGWGNYPGYSAGQEIIPPALASETVTAIAAGDNFSMALTDAGEVFAWGNNSAGNTTLPAQLATATVTAIAAGRYHSLALTDDGQVVSWGNSTNGATVVPEDLAAATFTAIAGGNAFTLATVEETYVAPQVTEQPDAVTVVAGSEATFTATATGVPTPTVQWEQSADGETWVDVEGATQTTLTFPEVADAQHGHSFRAVFTNAGGTIASDPATLTVHLVPSVTASPESVTVSAGEDVTFQAAATGRPTPGVQWEFSVDAGESWADLPGATDPDLMVSDVTSSESGTRFRATFTNVAGADTTEEAVLNVKSTPTIELTAPAKTAYGTAATVTVNIPGATGEVTLTVDGVPGTPRALVEGSTTFTTAKTLAVGTHTLAVSYPGDSNNESTQTTQDLQVSRAAAPTTKFAWTKKPTRTAGGTARVTLTTPAGLAKATGKVTVELRLGTRKIVRTATARNGIANLAIPRLVKGRWTIRVAYAGDVRYSARAAQAKGTITIR